MVAASRSSSGRSSTNVISFSGALMTAAVEPIIISFLPLLASSARPQPERSVSSPIALPPLRPISLMRSGGTPVRLKSWVLRSRPVWEVSTSTSRLSLPHLMPIFTVDMSTRRCGVPRSQIRRLSGSVARARANERERGGGIREKGLHARDTSSATSSRAPREVPRAAGTAGGRYLERDANKRLKRRDGTGERK